MTRLRALFAAGLLALVTTGAAASDTDRVVAVLSSNAGPYQEALAGFRSELGQNINHMLVDVKNPALPPAADIIVAFGAKASLREYPQEFTLIEAMATGSSYLRDQSRSSLINISLAPDPQALVASLKRLQPGLKRLSVL
ncbi:MAG: hypothetical protein WC881_04265, partial [Elusimicrobiota bacterium]